jgi:D-alanyl-D-alanine carboxypeptidase/D-alanyl-D-alanine-endopeptidase (penicillin-binding protein 4)
MRLLALNSLPSNQSNYDYGITRVKQVLSSLGVDVRAFIQTDGSGLGRSNMVQPNACVDVLFAMLKQKQWISMLPVGGVDGTLSDRFVGTAAAGRVHAKTGFKSL